MVLLVMRKGAGLDAKIWLSFLEGFVFPSCVVLFWSCVVIQNGRREVFTPSCEPQAHGYHIQQHMVTQLGHFYLVTLLSGIERS